MLRGEGHFGRPGRVNHAPEPTGSGEHNRGQHTRPRSLTRGCVQPERRQQGAAEHSVRAIRLPAQRHGLLARAHLLVVRASDSGPGRLVQPENLEGGRQTPRPAHEICTQAALRRPLHRRSRRGCFGVELQSDSVGLRLILVALACALALVAKPARAAFQCNDEGWEGTSEMLELARQSLGASRIRILATIEYDQLRPQDSLLILHPTVRLDRVQLSRFLLSGGRVALLDDYGEGASLLEHFQMRRVPAPLRPAMMLRDNSQLAVAVPVESTASGTQRARHPLVASVDQLVTNHPTGVAHEGLTPLLVIPANGEPDVTLAVTGVIASGDAPAAGEGGRLLVMGDPSAVINLMLRYPGNRRFASGLIEYLMERTPPGPLGTLYVVSNDFAQRGVFGGHGSVDGWLESQMNSVRELTSDWRRDGIPSWLATAFAGALALAVAIWAVTSMTQPFARMPPRYASTLPLIAQSGPAGRAAVLAAPTTHKGLAALELKSALQEGMTHASDMRPGAAPDVLFRALGLQDALQPGSYAMLRRLMSELKRVETRILSARPTRVTRGRINRWHRAAMQLLTEMSERTGRYW
jgi:hypothetical protein